jgi:hypothetical protein
VIEGDVFTEDAIIGGRVAGSIFASSRLELQGTCVVTGEIQARSEHLKLEEGARFEGRVHMLDGEAPERTAEQATGRRTVVAAAAATIALTSANGQPGANKGHTTAGDEGEGVVFELLSEEQRTDTEAPLLL